MADLSSLEPLLQPGSVHDPSYDATLQKCIREVLEQEAPILDKVLVDRVARAHGFRRSGRLISERVLELAERHFHFQPEPEPEPEHGDFVWLAADDPERWKIFRVPEREDAVVEPGFREHSGRGAGLTNWEAFCGGANFWTLEAGGLTLLVAVA